MTAYFDGVKESKVLTSGKTASRTRYTRPYARADWDASNASNDFQAPFREDYALVPPTGGMVTGSAGLMADQHQTTEGGWRIQKSGRYVQMEVTSTQGRVELHGVSVEAFRGDTRLTSKT